MKLFKIKDLIIQAKLICFDSCKESALIKRRGPKTVFITLSYDELCEIERALNSEQTNLALAKRLKVLLFLHIDSCVSAVARQSGKDQKYIRKWRDRFLQDGLNGLKTIKRSGRPPQIKMTNRSVIISMACAKPSDFGIQYRNNWTLDSLTKAYKEKYENSSGFDSISRTSIFRILNNVEIKPHRIKMWLHSPDPLFREKVTEICELYLRAPKPGVQIICVDEKTGMQALGRKHSGSLLKPKQDARMDFEYVRNGTRKMIASWNTQTGKIFAQVRERRTAADLVEFMGDLAVQYPKDKIHIIWDNLNIHYDGRNKRWSEFNRRHNGRFHFHYTPIHA